MSDAPKTRLFLLRHAHSSWALPGQRDHQRVLDERGREDAPKIGSEMARSGYAVEHVVCSSATRAAETFAAIRPFLQDFTEETSDDLYALGAEAYFAAVHRMGERRAVLLVGHNPMIEDFTVEIIAGSDRAAGDVLREGFPTAGLAVIEFDRPLFEVAPGTGHLARLIHPKFL